jgi:serine/threonine-protein kinase RsbW
MTNYEPWPGLVEAWSETWVAVPTSLTPIRYAVTSFADEVGVSQRTRDAIALAVSEAASNAIIHGFIEADEPGRLVITASMLDPERLRIVVSDDGCGMQPRLDSPGLGLGLPLISQLTERVDFGANGGSSGTVVTMDFLRLT